MNKENSHEKAGINLEEYNIGLVATPDHSDADIPGVLKIKYYIIVTTRKEKDQHPNPKLERKPGIMQSTGISRAISASRSRFVFVHLYTNVIYKCILDLYYYIHLRHLCQYSILATS